jgi:hypothetical protein
MPENRSPLQEDDDTHPGLSRKLVPRMICVHVAPDLNLLATRGRCIGRYVFLQITIKFIPVLLGEYLIVNVRLRRVQHKSGVCLCLKVREYPENCVQMAD